MGWGGRFDLGNYRSEPPGSVGSRVTARVIDAVVLVFLLAGAWIALVGQLRTQTYRLPREMFAEAFAGAAAEGTSGVQAGAARAVDGAVQETTDMLAVVLVLHIVVPVVYELAFQLMLGRTPGKLVCGLRVVPATGYDDRAGVVRGAVRATVFMGAPLTLVFLACHASALNRDTLATVYAIGFLAVCAALWLMTLPARRGLHDLASGTVVISTQRLNRLTVRFGT